jgi:hypothetical protein
MLLAPLGALAFFALITLFIVIPWLLDAWLGIPRLIPPPYNIVISAPLFFLRIDRPPKHSPGARSRIFAPVNSNFAVDDQPLHSGRSR